MGDGVPSFPRLPLPGTAPPGTVLVVEDNPGDARLVSIYLQAEAPVAFRVMEATRLRQALDLLAAVPVDVVLLDLSLPDSAGMETLDRLRAAAPTVAVVVLTGTDDQGLALKALRQGAQDYLVKGSGDGEVVRRAVRYAIERSRVDLALRGSEARFRAVFANAGIGVVVVEPSGRLSEVNPAFCAMLGYDQAAVQGKRVVEFTHPDDVARSEAALGDLAAGHTDNYEMVKRYLARDGRVVWARLTVSAVRETLGGPVRFAVAVIEDVTERKRLEDHMRLAVTVFDNTGDGLFITDAQRRIVQVNRAFTDITGYQAGEVLGKTPAILSSGRHGTEFYEQMWESLRTVGRWQGEIWDRRRSGEMFAGWQSITAVRGGEGEVTHYVAVISDITSRKEVEERLSYAANHDPLTRLPNRSLFQERLSRALARAHRNQDVVAVLFIDLDRFKEVNDTLGHLAGDLLLLQVAERIGVLIRQGDTLARLSGDEFTVILEDIQDPRDAAVVAHKILRVLGEPFDLGPGQTVTISGSIGVAVYPMDAGDAQTLVKLADGAMYRAKRLGRNGCQFHSEAANVDAFRRLVLEDSLRGALERGEFRVFYQPLFDARTGRVAAVEALLRWQHAEIGLVEPFRFLALAEEIGLVLPIGRWVVETACRQMREWHAMGFPDLVLDVNLSPRELRQPEVANSVAEILENSGLPPASLTLELPESAVVDKGAEPGGPFARLAKLGVSLTIDEFGAGFSSFTFLRRLPARALKVSQSFVRNVTAGTDDAEIVTAIVAVARGLHMAVVAPGIETGEQLAFMTAAGCDFLQGFLLARPMPAEAMGEYLRAGTVPAALAGRKA